MLAREHALRQKFHEEITEQQKAEFINGQVVMHSPVQHGVEEYWLVNPQAEAIEKFKLEAGQFVAAGVFNQGASPAPWSPASKSRSSLCSTATPTSAPSAACWPDTTRPSRRQHQS